jgi:tRNA pseudouridine38-40 synthase
MAHPYFLVLAYVGTGFHGWQVQTSRRTVQGELAGALRRLWPDAPMPQGTGRTDAGVHARAQGALAWAQRAWDPQRLMAALNAHLPWDVRVTSAMEAPEGFFPRQHAVAKRYVYRLGQGHVADPFAESRRWHVHGSEPLDEGAMAAGASTLVGTHDFSSFRCSECAAATPIRTIFDARLEPGAHGLDMVFEGDRFLMHQVRIMAGTLIDVGRGRTAPGRVAEILESRDRRAAGATAPAMGLYLEKIWYGRGWGIGEPCPWRGAECDQGHTAVHLAHLPR